jgi:uncharacterized surface protein with fasciclin (FAS1) repeats
MKITSLSKTAGFLMVLLVMGYASCVKSSTTLPPIQNPTVAQLIQSATNLTLFNAGLVRAGLDTILNDPASEVTVFVCTDQVMTQNGLNATVIDTLPIQTLKNLLEYYISAGNATLSTNFPAGPNAPWQVSSGDSVFITSAGSSLYVNGIGVPTTDVSASNGYIDVLALPLFPPAGNILQITTADTTLSYFDSAVVRTASSTLFNIQSLLTSGNISTVFVPNNNAFRNAGFINIDTFNLISPDTLAQFLAYHIISKRYFTSDMGIAINNVSSSDTATQVTLSGNSIKIILGASFYQAEGNSDSVAANLYAPNIVARNGVVQRIDRVLR